MIPIFTLNEIFDFFNEFQHYGDHSESDYAAHFDAYIPVF